MPMALIGRLYAIASGRRLYEEVRYELAYRWSGCLPLDGRVPHHSTFSKNRHGRFRDAGLFRVLFGQTVRRRRTAGLVRPEDSAIDASFVAADASWQRKMRDGHLDAPRLARPVREWLTDRDEAPGPAALSRTDPAPAWAKRPSHGRFGYSLNVQVDVLDGVALVVEARPARFAAEIGAGRTMLRRPSGRFVYRPKRVLADQAYEYGVFLAFVHGRGAVPPVPVLERSGQKGASSRAGRFVMSARGTATFAPPARCSNAGARAPRTEFCGTSPGKRTVAPAA
jgi:hypothetical protein